MTSVLENWEGTGYPVF